MRASAAIAVVAAVFAVPLSAQMQGPPAPVRDAESAIAGAQALVGPEKQCQPSDDGTITVCGTDTDRHRLTPELRAIAGIGQSTRDSIPPAPPATAMSLDRLPYNWISLGGRFPPGPEYNALYELAKERTDPETGAPPPDETEP